MAININDEIFGLQMRHAMTVEKFNKSFNREVQGILSESDDAVKKLIASGSMTDIDDIIRKASIRINGAYSEVSRLGTRELSGLIGNEVAFQNGVLEKRIGDILEIKRVLPQEVRKAILNTNMVVGKSLPYTFSGHTRNLAKAEIVQLRAGVRQALTNGLTESQAVDFIYDNTRFTAPNRVTRGQMRAVVRTAITDVQSYSAREVFRANSDIIEKYKYSSTLDTRTSEICQRLDGAIFPVEGDSPRPPQHYNCRSAIVPIVKAYEDIPPMLRTGPAPAARRASMNGQVPASNNYSDWLFTQTSLIQNTVLGPARAEVFREGYVSVKQLIGRNGDYKSIGAARVEDFNTLAGKETPITSQVATRYTDDLEETLSTNRQWQSKASQSEIDDFFSHQALDLDSEFGTMNLIKNPGPDLWNEELQRYVSNTFVSFEREGRGVWQSQLASVKEAVNAGAISAADRTWILAKADSLTNRNLIDLHQRTALVRVLVKRFANNNGYSGRLAGAGRWALDPDVIRIPTNINVWLKEALTSESRHILGRYRKARIARETNFDEIYKIGDINRRINRFEKNLSTTAMSDKVVNKLNEVFKANGIDIDFDALPELSNTLTNILARSAGRDVGRVAESIGEAMRVYLAIDDSLDIVGLVRENIRIGGVLVDGLTDVLPYRTYLLNRELRDGIYRDNIVIEPTDALRGSWVQYADDIADRTIYSRLPNTEGKLAKVNVGDVVDSNGVRIITAKESIDYIPEVNQHQVNILDQAKRETFRIDDDYLFGIEVLAEEFPELFVKGGYTLKNPLYDDVADYILTDKFERMIALAKYNQGRVFGYNHTLQPGGRLHPQASSLSYNGPTLEKGLHRNSKTSTILDGDDAFAQFRFEAAEYIGARHIKVDGIKMLFTLDTVEERIFIFSKLEKDMLKLGEALLSGDRGGVIRYSRILKSVNSKNVGGLLRASIEYAKIERYRKRTGTLNGYKTGYRVGQDATASALQINAMLIRDAALARGSNIIPRFNSKGNQVKNSAYLDVFPALQSSKVWNSNKFLKALDEEQALAILKMPVLSTLYNIRAGTLRPSQRTGILGQLREALEDIDDEVFAVGKLTDGELIALADATEAAITKIYPQLGRTTRAIDRLFSNLSSTGIRARWQLPLTKQHVEYGVKRQETFDVEYNIGGSKVIEQRTIFLDEISVSDTGFRGPPTFVHSIDSDIIQWMRLQAQADGKRLQTNHDSFWSNLEEYKYVDGLYKEALIMIQEADVFGDIIRDAVTRKAMTQKQGNTLLDLFDSISPDDLGDYLAAFRGAEFPIS